MTMARECLWRLFPQVCSRISELPQDGTLSQYAKQALTPPFLPQVKADDFIECSVNEAKRLFGENRARLLKEELSRQRAVLTANHLCPSYNAEFLQGDLLFALQSHCVVPIFAFGGIPLDNSSFPRGMLVASRDASSFKPYRLPLLTNAWRRRMVSSAPAFSRKDIEAGLRPCLHAPLSARERETVLRVIDTVHLAEDVLKETSLADQMCAVAVRLWDLVRAPSDLPPAVVLDIQAVAKRLIIRDLLEPDSLVARIVLNEPLTRTIYRELEGRRACWSHAEKERGTFLFWHPTGECRNAALRLHPDKPELHAVDGSGFSVALQPEVLLEALHSGQLIPSLYLTFAALTMARGVICAGGIFQSDYLPLMIEKTAQSMALFAGQSDPQVVSLRQLAQSEAMSPFMTGMLPLWTKLETGVCQPAGAIECIAAGGLTKEITEKIAHCRVREAFLAAAVWFYEEMTPKAERAACWQQLLAQPAPVLI